MENFDVIQMLENMIDGKLDISNIGISELPDSYLWAEVKELYCSTNWLMNLPDLPECRILYCDCNELVKLPELPKCKELYCTINRLESLPELPECQILYCNVNELASLPALPKCQELNCDYNNITILPELPNCKILYCKSNKLITLPNLPKCKSLHCDFHNIIKFSYLAKCKELSCKYNRNLNVLPYMPKCETIYYSNTSLLYNPDYNDIIHIVRRHIIVKSILGRWRRYVRNRIAAKKRDLHNELLYSPNLSFYKNRPEYIHWLDNKDK
jgi:hypothetical protein